MRKLLVGIIKFAGRQLERLGEIHNNESVNHLEIAHETKARLVAKAGELLQEGDRVLADGRQASRKAHDEAVRCLAVAHAVKFID